MRQIHPDSDSDSDSEYSQSSILLGVPDGSISTPTDLTDAAVSRIGGHPAFLSSHNPPVSSSHCKNCSNQMELLAQIWCPFEDSDMDRALYIWGCARGSCKGRQGSVRAWRGLRFNQSYAIKLEKKLARKRQKEKTKTATTVKTQMPIVNPFSATSVYSPNPLSIGTQIFNTSPPPPPESPSSSEDEDDRSSQSSSESSATSFITAPTTQPASSPWRTTPTYPPQYLSTIPEYLPPPPKHAKQIPEIQEDEKNSKDWAALESYESSLSLDPIFTKFTTRISHEPTQCIRYELNGNPLPYASDAIYATLFPSPPSSSTTTKPAFTVASPKHRPYAPSVPSCAHCGSTRVFECQLMPNLINALTPETKTQSQTDDERRKELQRLLTATGKEKGGMEWGTCLIFSCKDDCCIDDNSERATECWREEIVLVQWDE